MQICLQQQCKNPSYCSSHTGDSCVGVPLRRIGGWRRMCCRCTKKAMLQLQQRGPPPSALTFCAPTLLQPSPMTPSSLKTSQVTPVIHALPEPLTAVCQHPCHGGRNALLVNWVKTFVPGKLPDERCLLKEDKGYSS